MKVVVFGAGGFIGGWICEELANCKNVKLVPCVRHWSSAVRLARRGLDVVQVDLEQVTDDLAVISDADVVVNVSKPLPEREPELASRLYSACAIANVRKFIQFSSIAVYGDQTGNITEDMPASPSNEYGRRKTEMENWLLKSAAQSGPQLFILRLSIVYGPFSDDWTVNYARRIAQGRWRSLGWAGDGTCNLVHCQDVAKSVIFAALTHSNKESHVLNINGPEVITWDEYIARFGDALRVASRTKLSPLKFSLTSYAVHGIRKAGSWAKSKGLAGPLQKKVPAATERAQSAVKLYPTPDELHLWRHKARYSWERADRIIGFTPLVSLEEGLQQSADWCRIHGVVP